MSDPFFGQKPHRSSSIPVPVDKRPEPSRFYIPESSHSIPVPVGQKDLISQIVPAVAGGVNSLAFGLPEAGLKALSNEEQKAAIDKWKAENPGFGVGEVAGTIGSMAIPGGAIARGIGLGAKALGASKVAGGLEKFANAAAGPAGVKSAVAQAVEQGIPRSAAIAGMTGSGEEAGADLANNVLMSAPMAKGVVAAEKVAKPLVELLQSRLGKQYISGFAPSQLNKARKEDVEAYHQAVSQKYPGVTPEVAPPEIVDSVGKYTLNYDQELNEFLRSGKTESLTPKAAADMVKNIMAHIDSNRLIDDTPLFRGFNRKFAAEVGDVLRPKAFQSFSSSDVVARSFAKDGAGTIMELVGKKGQPIAPLGNLSKYLGDESEAEYLMKPGTGLKIVGKYDINKGPGNPNGTRVYQVEVVE